jgi:hypothetical protein
MSGSRKHQKELKMATLYRASNHTDTPVFTCFAKEQEDAEAYLDNPGFGGDTLYRVSIKLGKVLDLTGTDGLLPQCRELLEEAGFDRDEVEDICNGAGFECVGDLPAHVSRRVLEAVKALGETYGAVKFTDSFPANCTTYMLLRPVECAEFTAIN